MGRPSTCECKFLECKDKCGEECKVFCPTRMEGIGRDLGDMIIDN